MVKRFVVWFCWGGMGEGEIEVGEEVRVMVVNEVGGDRLRIRMTDSE